jgi:hypothetical protein
LLPFGGSEHKKEAMFYWHVATGNSSESPTPHTCHQALKDFPGTSEVSLYNNKINLSTFSIPFK